MKLFLELLGELGFRAFCVAWFLGCMVGLGLLGVPLGYQPRYGVIVGAVIGAAVPLVWWIKRQLDEQRELDE